MKRSGVVVTWNSHCCNLHVSLQIEILVNYMHAGLKCFITKTVTVYVQFIIFIIYRQSQVECGLRALYCSLRLLKYKTMACQNFVLFQGETRPWNEGIIQIYKLSTLEVQKNVFFNICFLSLFSWKRTSYNKNMLLNSQLILEWSISLRLWVDEMSTFVQMSPETVERVSVQKCIETAQ